MEWKRKTNKYLLVISASFSLVPRDEFGLEPGKQLLKLTLLRI